MVASVDIVKQEILKNFPELDKNKVESFFFDRFFVQTEKQLFEKKIINLKYKLKEVVSRWNRLKHYSLPLIEEQIKKVKSGEKAPLLTFKSNNYEFALSMRTLCNIDENILTKDLSLKYEDFKLFILEYNRLYMRNELKTLKSKIHSFNEEIHKMEKELEEK